MRILIVRLSAMGDIIHSLPAVAALRRAYPQARIGWAIEDRWLELLSTRTAVGDAQRSPARPLVDVIHKVNTRAWRNAPFSGATWRNMREVVRELRHERYDLAVDMQAAIRSAVLAKFSRTPRRVGFARPREAPAKLFYTEIVAAPAVHVVDQGLQLDSARVRDRMEQALSSGVLTVARADGEFTLVGGQARAVNVKVNAQGVDVGVSGSALLADDTIDARLTLSPPERPDAPAGTRPEVTVTLKGATDAPKRAIDVTAFFNWLALRAVDQQSKRIDALEAARETREKDQSKDQGSKEQAPKEPAAASRTVPSTTGTTPPSPPAARRPTNQPSAGAPATGSARPQQPLDLRPPASSGGSFLDNLLGR